MESSLNYTVTSTNAKEYDVIRTNLQIPNSDISRLMVNNLTTKASFIVLGVDDYVIKGITNKYSWNKKLMHEEIKKVLNERNLFYQTCC